MFNYSYGDAENGMKLNWFSSDLDKQRAACTTRRVGINNSSKPCHQRTASEVCCFANEQKDGKTVNRNSSDNFIPSQLSLFVTLDALMLCAPAGHSTIHSSTLPLPEASNLGVTHLLPLPPPCADDGWMKDGAMNLSSPHLFQSPF